MMMYKEKDINAEDGLAAENKLISLVDPSKLIGLDFTEREIVINFEKFSRINLNRSR